MRIERSAHSDDQHDGPPTTVAETLVDLRETLQRGATAGTPRELPDETIKRLCAFARNEQIPAELLLIQLKRTLNTIPGLDGRSGETEPDMRARLVSAVIDAYFAT